jgi:ubiquinone biosynthesis O-methyltransferase
MHSPPWPHARRRPSAAGAPSSSVDEGEVRKFGALAAQWWQDVEPAPFAGLHRLNAVRVPLIRRAILGSAPPAAGGLPLAGVRILDVGCGGGILSEALARLGATVTGIDAAARNVQVASHHAGLDPAIAARVTYECTTVEAVAAAHAAAPPFDAVVCSEVVEHVADAPAFLAALAATLRPGGPLVITTINRTLPAFALAIVGAEYVLRAVPAGTHEWVKFLPPAEVEAALRPAGVHVEAVTGLWYSPLTATWSTRQDTSVNYALVGRKAGAGMGGAAAAAAGDAKLT